MEDETIATVMQIKREEIASTNIEKYNESNEVRMLLRDIKKFTLSNDSVLYGYTTDKQQLVLPEKADTRIQRYQDTQRVERPKMSSITSRETLNMNQTRMWKRESRMPQMRKQ